MKKNIERLIDLLLFLVALTASTFCIYLFVDWTTDLFQKGWLPAVIFIVVTVCAATVITMIFFKNKVRIVKSTPPVTSTEKNPKVVIEDIHKEDVNTPLTKDLTVPVLGMSRVGMSSIIRELQKLKDNLHTDGENATKIHLKEVSALKTSIRDNTGILEQYSKNRLAILVVTKDLTNYEWDAATYLIEKKVFVIIVVNKVDNMSSVEIQETAQSIRQKIEDLALRASLVQTKADPKDQVVIIQSEDGAESEEIRKQQPDLKELIESIISFVFERTKSKSIIFS